MRKHVRAIQAFRRLLTASALAPAPSSAPTASSEAGPRLLLSVTPLPARSGVRARYSTFRLDE